MNAMSADLLTEVAPSLSDFDRLGEDFVVFFKPPALDERIVNQYALFSVMPSPQERMDKWLEERPELGEFDDLVQLCARSAAETGPGMHRSSRCSPGPSPPARSRST